MEMNNGKFFFFQLLRPLNTDENTNCADKAHKCLILFPKHSTKLVKRYHENSLFVKQEAGSGISPVSVVLVAGERSGRRSSSSSRALSGCWVEEILTKLPVKYSTGSRGVAFIAGDTVLPCNSHQRTHH